MPAFSLGPLSLGGEGFEPAGKAGAIRKEVEVWEEGQADHWLTAWCSYTRTSWAHGLGKQG